MEDRIISKRSEPSRYEELANYMARHNHPGSRRRGNDLAVHRLLQIPPIWRAQNPDAADSDFLYDLAVVDLELQEPYRLLDVGCGFGAAGRRLAQSGNSTSIGISNSPRQIEIARRVTLSQELDEYCQFQLATFEEQVTRNVDLALAVESLIHSPQLTDTMQALADQVAVGGYVVIVDDMSTSNLGKRPNLAAFEDQWGVTCFWSEEEYLKAIQESGLTVVQNDDWSSRLKLLMPWRGRTLLFAARVLATITNGEFSRAMHFHAAQLEFQARHRAGEFTYRRIVARKGYQQVRDQAAP